jgi:peptidoglycan hydrolase-like protein with peptidoglycan-binding domain
MGNPLSPGKKTKYITEKAGVEILAIKDENPTEYHGGKEMVNLKILQYIDEQLEIDFKVMGLKQKINVWVEYKPSKIHDNFYNQYKGNDFSPPRVANIIIDQWYEPGKYYVKWDGRDSTNHLRLLIAGDYRVVIEGKTATWSKTDKTTLKVDKPEAYLYGIHYQRGGSSESSKKSVEHVEKKVKSLKDGSGFDATSYLDRQAIGVVEDMKQAALSYHIGHSGPFVIVLYSVEGGKFKKKNQTYLYLYGTANDHPPPNACIQAQPEGCFKDMFLAVFNGCRAGNEVSMLQWRLKSFNPGPIDGKHGERTTKALRNFQTANSIAPNDGTKNAITLLWFGLSEEKLSERKTTRKIQRKLKSYSVRRISKKGVMNNETRRALKNYQRDHPRLNVTGKPDEKTLKALNLGDLQSMSSLPRNVADAMRYKGADITVGFIHSVRVDYAKEWARKFWNNLANGQGIRTAGKSALSDINARLHMHVRFRVYARDGISMESTMHPARHGAVSLADL